MNIPLNIDWQQILLHLFNFVLLFAISYFLLYSPVLKFMNKRREYYKKLDDDANAKLSDANEKDEKLSKLLSDSDEKLRLRESEETARIDKLCSERLARAEAEAREIVQKAQENAEKEKKRIIDSAQSDITEIAYAAAEKLAFKNSSEAFDSFLDNARGDESDDE